MVAAVYQGEESFHAVLRREAGYRAVALRYETIIFA
jgi:hypothetical protein